MSVSRWTGGAGDRAGHLASRRQQLDAPPPPFTREELVEENRLDLLTQNHQRDASKRLERLLEAVDPPPDVVVEIDTTNESLGKFPIYAALGVPEIWRYDGRAAQFFQLIGASYQEITNSRAFPALTASALTEFIEQSKTQGQSAACDAFRQWWRAQAPSAS